MESIFQLNKRLIIIIIIIIIIIMPRNSDRHNYVNRDSSVGIVTRCRQEKRFCTYLQGSDGRWDPPP